MKMISDNGKYIVTVKVLQIMLMVFAMLGFLGPMALKQFNLALLGTYLGLPMLSGSIIWSRLKAKEMEDINVSEDLNEILILFFSLCFFVTLLILHYLPVRTLSYYVLVAVMGVTVLIQILYTKEICNHQIKIILMQIILLFLNIIWGVTLKYHYFVGRTDILFHSWLIENLIGLGYINQTFDVYEAFPLWHILCSFIYQIMNLPIIPAKIMFFINGLIYGCLALIIYSAASKMFNTKIALLSALLMCFNTDVIFYGMYSIPRSVVFCLEGLLIVLLLKQKTLLDIALLILITLGLIIYHTASMPFIISILALFYLLQGVYSMRKSERSLDFNFLLLMFVTTLTYWMYAGVKVFNSVSKSLLREAPVGMITKSVVETPLQELFNYLQYSPLLLFVIVGVLWGLYAARVREVAKIFLVMSLLLVPVTFPGPALLFNKLAGNFNFARFGEYSFIFICIAGAVGIYILFYKLKIKYKISVIILSFIMAFLAVSNDFTASDNPLIKRPFYTFYLTEEENIALRSVAQMAEGFLMTDYISCRYLESSDLADKVHVLEVNPRQQIFLRSTEEDIIFLRKTELTKRPLKLFTSPNDVFIFKPSLGTTLDYYYKDLPLWDTIESYNVIYDSGAVMAFQ